MEHDAEILDNCRRAKQGDRNAVAWLMRRYEPMVLYCLRSIQCNRYMKDELVQVAWVRIFSKLNYYKPHKGRLSTWIYHVAYNEAITYMRRESKQRSTVSLGEYDIPIEHADTIESAELRNRIDVLIDRLPSERRAVMALRERHGMSYEEIAQVMDKPMGTVKSIIFRSKQQMATDTVLQEMA